MPTRDPLLDAFDSAAGDPLLAAFDSAVKKPVVPPNSIEAQRQAFIANRARNQAHNRAIGALPGGQVNFRPATMDEKVKSAVIGGVGGLIENAAAVVALPIGATYEAIAHPFRQGKKLVDIATSDAPISEKIKAGAAVSRDVPNLLRGATAVENVANRVIPAVKRAGGIDPNAITDTIDAGSRLAGGLVDIPVAKMLKLGGKGAKLASAIDEVPIPKAAPKIEPPPAPKPATAPPSPAKVAKAETIAEAVEKSPETKGDLPKYARPSSVNLERLDIDEPAKRQLIKVSEQIRPELEKAKGATVTNSEILQAAEDADLLRSVTPRSKTVAETATMLRTRQHLAALAEGKVGIDYIETLRRVSAEATDLGRQLQALKITAGPEKYQQMDGMLKRLTDMGLSSDELAKALENVNVNSAKEMTAFYRQFVKPTAREILSEYRYINMLSSPKTHLVNAFTNLTQTVIGRPAVRLASGAIDRVGSGLTGQQREFYVSQVPHFYKGVANGVGDAFREAMTRLKGDAAIENLDMQHIPTNSPLTKPFYGVTRALEAGDVFFRTLAEAGEREALAAGERIAGRELTEATTARLGKQAQDTAEYSVFRKKLDPSNETGQGNLLSSIDNVTAAVQMARNTPVLKWFVPFVQTPANILKQGIEFSPLGVATLPGNAKKVEQLGKSAIGSMVFAGAGVLAAQGRTTWAAPSNSKDKTKFYAEGMQPYSIRIGDKWVSYAKLGPMAYPIAMAAAFKHASEQPDKDMDFDMAVQALSGIAKFFAEQSYVQGIGNLVATAQGEEEGMGKVVATFPGQLVPLGSLLRWVNGVVDPVHRKTATEPILTSAKENVQKGIPGWSKSLPAYEATPGVPSQKQHPLINAVSPMNVSTMKPDAQVNQRLTLLERASKKIEKDEKMSIQERREKVATIQSEIRELIQKKRQLLTRR